MKTKIKLISFLLLSAIAYATTTPYTLISITYTMKGKSYSYQIDDSNLSKELDDSDALSIFKSAEKKYKNNYIEVLFKIEVKINRDISNLVISDEIDSRVSYQESSLLLNNKSLAHSNIVKNMLNVTIGDAKEGEVYILQYRGRVNQN